MEKALPKTDRYVIDWPEMKLVALRVMEGDGRADFKLSENYSEAKRVLAGDSWRGYTTGQLERWIRSGYRSENTLPISEFVPPIREKRKLRFTEEGDEFNFDLAASGADNVYSEWSKRDVIPGLAVEAEIGMVSANDSRVLTSYFQWLNTLCYSLESAGVDCEVTLKYEAARHIFASPHMGKKACTVVRVKRENEQSDFLGWSAMLSPASFRSLMFLADVLHADARGWKANSSHGQRDRSGWSLEYLRERQTLRVDCAWSAREFPEAEMNRQLREALKEIMRKA